VSPLRHPDQDCPYGECDGDGMAVDEATNTARPCRCRAERVALRRKRKMEGRLRRAIPKRYLDMSFERHPLDEIASLHPIIAQEVRAYVSDLDGNLEAGRGLWLCGTKGTGKTSLAYYVSAAAARAGHSVLSWNTITLLNDLRDSLNSDRGAGEIIDAACSVDLLQLEDLSAARTTEWVLEQLYLIVNRRYEDQRAIVFTSDLPDASADPHALAEHVGERTFSRLLAMCSTPLVMNGQDMRLAVKV
jgi:DNA replication protein DnaC